jgi:EAL domain-containing protein (putative c-di-GMP-specific phosphodiesterase class I)
MYRAKARGSARYEVFDGRMREETVARVQLEADLRRALEHDELLVHYQPIVSLADGHVHAVEALVRWQHPERGVLSPADFLPVAEETGLITTLGEWVLETAVAQHAAWASQGLPPIGMTVNLSPRQLMDPTLAQTVAHILHRHAVDPASIAIELTETAIMEDIDTAAAMVDRLADLGVRILIDDFGTGYSSIAHLQRLPVSGIKIDRDFITGMADDERSGKLIGALIALAHALELEVVAEGVDNEVARDMLRDLGCEFAQGFLFCPPVSPDALPALLR